MGIFSNIFGKRPSSNNPEDDFLVTITETSVKVQHPTRKTEELFWADLIEIRLVNTDTGPALPDVWLMLAGTNSGCLIPQGAKGYDEVYEIVSKYKDFDFEKVIESMGCTDNAQFVVWKKS